VKGANLMTQTTKQPYSVAAAGLVSQEPLTAEAFLSDLTPTERFQFFPVRGDDFPRTVGRFVDNGCGGFNLIEDRRPSSADIDYVYLTDEHFSGISIETDEYINEKKRLFDEHERRSQEFDHWKRTKGRSYFKPRLIAEEYDRRAKELNNFWAELIDKLNRMDRTVYDRECRGPRLFYIAQLLEKNPGLTPDSWRKANGLISDQGKNLKIEQAPL
jgi:hypothetical protein